MRLLYLTSGFPYPLTTGRLRHYHLLRELHSRHEIVLLSLADAAVGADDIDAVRPFAEVRVVRRGRGSASAPRRAGRVLRRVAGRVEPEVVTLGDAARELIDAGRVDAVIYSGRRAAPALARLRDVPVVADLCDATSLALAGRARVAPPRERPVLRLRALAARATERRIIAASDALVFATPRDRDAVLGSPAPSPHDRPVAIIPNGLDLDTWQRADPVLGSAIVFTGAMDYAPNVDAAVRLARHILPGVRTARPGTSLVIAGRDPAPAVRALETLPGVTVTGAVPDMRPILDAAAVFAAPLRFGAGIQNKLLEALAMGVPTVATTLAARGLRTADGIDPPIDIADPDEAFIRCLVDRLDAAAADPTPDARGRAFVADHFAWPAVAALLDGLLDDVAASRRARR